MIAPASLKPEDHVSNDIDGVLPLRGMIAPASLKRPDRRRRSAGCPATPGHDCPGLIEAGVPTGAPAPAGPSTPGHDCPGLIEAIRGGSGGGMRITPLRGMIAPASLKLVAFRIARRVRHATPGHDCPGLIEAGRAASPRGAAAGTPGHDCPGLIEARSEPRRLKRVAGTHSGA